MYILKNAFKSIIRAKARTILFFTIVFVIATSGCVALSIKNSADKAKEITYNKMSVSATITTDRSKMMNGTKPSADNMQEMMDKMSQSLSLEELEKFAKAESVKDFNYTGSVGLNGTDEFQAYSSSNGNNSNNMMKDKMNMMMGKNKSDFTLIGASSHNAMTSFSDGTTVITEGKVFDESDTSNNCVISKELAYVNDITTGDTFTVVNPSKEDETITFTVAGIFECESSDSLANHIYISYPSLQNIALNSAEVSETLTNKQTGAEYQTALVPHITGNYIFSDLTSYENFENEAAALGLDTETYTVSSSDATQFEQSLQPLENLSKFTNMFFWIVLIIGAVILIVFNLFSIRERKYEMGVLAAIGMHKSKVALQFLTEVFLITVLAVGISVAAGSAVSKPIGENLLSSQIASVKADNSQVNKNFGGNFGGRQPSKQGMNMKPDMAITNVEYVDNIDIGIDTTVVLQLMLMGIALTLVSSSAAIISVLRYEPLKILSER